MRWDLKKGGLSLILTMGILVVTAGIIFISQTTLQDIEHSLPVTVLEQDRDVTQLLLDTTELVSAVRQARSRPSPEALDEVLARLQEAEEQLNRIRGSYNFDNLLGASAIHAVINPALVDIRIWLTSGIYSNAPHSPLVLGVVDTRITQALERMRSLYMGSSSNALDILKRQSLRIESFRNEIIIVLMVLAAMGVFLAIHVYRLRKAEEAVLKSEKRFKDFAESASDWFWEMGPNLRFTYFSARFTETTNLQASDIIGKKREEVGNPDVEVKSWKQHLDDLQSRNPFRNFEYHTFRPDGSKFYCQVSGLPMFDGDGTFLGYRGTGTDITDRKQAEKANIDKSAFLAAASHDMRQPLQAMSLFLYALKNNENSSANREIIGLIEKSAASLGHLLDSLLDLSRLESGVVKIEKKTFSVSTMFDRLVDEYSQAAADKDLRLDFAPCSLNVRSDPILLESILRNLISNAIKYTGSGRVLIGCRRKGADEVQIQVWDTGKGIAQDQQSRIFNEFYQLGVNPGNAEKGLGLGLSIVQKIAALLNHELGISSEPGHGSVFSITVPLERSSAVHGYGLENADKREMPKNLSIVVIDDEEAVRKSLSVMLAASNNRVASAPCVDCLDEVQMLTFPRERPDIIIADYRLANDKTGVEAISNLCKFYEKDIPAILLTGDTATDRLQEITQSGYSLLHKPVNGDELLLQIHDVLSQEPTAKG